MVQCGNQQEQLLGDSASFAPFFDGTNARRGSFRAWCLLQSGNRCKNRRVFPALNARLLVAFVGEKGAGKEVCRGGGCVSLQTEILWSEVTGDGPDQGGATVG